MIKKEIAKMLNEQINKELHSGYLYLEFANYYESKNLPGFAKWFVAQSNEEMEHAIKMRTFLIKAGEKVTFSPIADTEKDFTDVKGPLVAALKHEQYITQSIYAIYEKALELKDYFSAHFLQWFIDEQAEEEASAQSNIDKLDMIGSSGSGLYMLDREMGSRG